jgi:hypothetical protein
VGQPLAELPRVSLPFPLSTSGKVKRPGTSFFSSFSLESVRMMLAGSVGKGILNVGINVIMSFLLTFAGLLAAERL